MDVTGLIDRFYRDLWNAWDDAAVDAVLAPDVRFRGSLGEQTEGRDGWRAYRDRVRAGSADFTNTVTELVVEGDRGAARLGFAGTHTGPLLGIPATGRRFEYAGAAFFVADAGLLRDIWVLGDLDTLRRRLGDDPA